MNYTHAKKVNEIVRSYRHLTIGEIVKDRDISVGSCYKIRVRNIWNLSLGRWYHIRSNRQLTPLTARNGNVTKQNPN